MSAFWQEVALWALEILVISAAAAAYSVEQLGARILLVAVAFAALCGLLWSI